MCKKKKIKKRHFREGRGVSFMSYFSVDKTWRAGNDMYLLCVMIVDHVALLARHISVFKILNVRLKVSCNWPLSTLSANV